MIDDVRYLQEFVCGGYSCGVCPLHDTDSCRYRYRLNAVSTELLKAVCIYMNTKTPAQRKQCSRVNKIMAKYMNMKAVIL